MLSDVQTILHCLFNTIQRPTSFVFRLSSFCWCKVYVYTVHLPVLPIPLVVNQDTVRLVCIGSFQVPTTMRMRTSQSAKRGHAEYRTCIPSEKCNLMIKYSLMKGQMYEAYQRLFFKVKVSTSPFSGDRLSVLPRIFWKAEKWYW
jgi:hypothetical protein